MRGSAALGTRWGLSKWAAEVERSSVACRDAECRIAAVVCGEGSPDFGRILSRLPFDKDEKGELDLERFVSIDAARNDLKPFQSMIEMLDAGEMPPKGKPQPTAEQRKWLIDWTRRWLDVEARSRAGDPGQVALRRLSNAEYNCTVRDLTGVDLQPAREFPADGAAGEGFTNASEALSMSSTLVDKYLAAAKGIADHAVMLPDGFRFSPSAHQHDWIDESLGAMHQFYGQFIDGEGQIPLRRYLTATIQYRAALAKRTKTFAEVAQQENLSAKYLEMLWNTLNDTKPSLVLDGIRSRWKTASLNDVPAIVAQIESWQKVAWTLNNKAACIYEPWQVPNRLVNGFQDFRVKLSPQAGKNEIVLYLVARTVAGEPGGGQPMVLWDKAQIRGRQAAAAEASRRVGRCQGMEGAAARVVPRHCEISRGSGGLAAGRSGGFGRIDCQTAVSRRQAAPALDRCGRFDPRVRRVRWSRSK